MRHLLLVVALVGCAESKNDLADPTKPFHAVTLYGTGEQITGHLEGTRANPVSGQPEPAGVPYKERIYDAGGTFEFWPNEPTTLGTNVGMLASLHVGYLGGGSVDGMTADAGFLPLSMGVGWGTVLQLVRREGLLLAVHSSLNLDYNAERIGHTGDSWLVVYGGLRGYYETGPLRTRVQYDFMPFWTGESRLEHRITGLVSKRPNDGRAIGVRLGVEVGQKRLAAGGLNDVAFTIGVEVQ
jgi:hypothetical protein